jgi:hypothetical protein
MTTSLLSSYLLSSFALRVCVMISVSSGASSQTRCPRCTMGNRFHHSDHCRMMLRYRVTDHTFVLVTLVPDAVSSRPGNCRLILSPLTSFTRFFTDPVSYVFLAEYSTVNDAFACQAQIRIWNPSVEFRLDRGQVSSPILEATPGAVTPCNCHIPIKYRVVGSSTSKIG